MNAIFNAFKQQHKFQITFASTHLKLFLFVLGGTGNKDAYFLQRQKGKLKMLEKFKIKWCEIF